MTTRRVLLSPEASGGGFFNAPLPARPVAPIASGASGVSGTAVAPTPPAEPEKSKIQQLDQKLAGGRHEDSWNRTPSTPGTGAIHCRSFHCKLNSESLGYLDKQINEWLDAHPQYEVKLVTSSIGEWQGKVKEPNLILQVWV